MSKENTTANLITLFAAMQPSGDERADTVHSYHCTAEDAALVDVDGPVERVDAVYVACTGKYHLLGEEVVVRPPGANDANREKIRERAMRKLTPTERLILGI